MEGLTTSILTLLDAIQKNLYARAVKFREDHTARVTTYDEFKALMEGRPGFVIAGWCGGADCEAQIKTETQATLRNIPFTAERTTETCVKCGQPAAGEAWFAKAY